MRKISTIDHWITQADKALQVAVGPPPGNTQPSPAVNIADHDLAESERRHAAGLMRVNHTGEVCAQALYAGQAATAKSDHVRLEMAEAAKEEEDHLAWCAERLDQLQDRPSYLNPLWYASSFSIGAVAGLMGDRWSLGFVEATERQVESHLEDHLDSLPAPDQRSRAIVSQMKEDEARHADMAVEQGARTLPGPVQGLMAGVAGIMKLVAYRL